MNVGDVVANGLILVYPGVHLGMTNIADGLTVGMLFVGGGIAVGLIGAAIILTIL